MRSGRYGPLILAGNEIMESFQLILGLAKKLELPGSTLAFCAQREAPRCTKEKKRERESPGRPDQESCQQERRNTQPPCRHQICQQHLSVFGPPQKKNPCDLIRAFCRALHLHLLRHRDVLCEWLATAATAVVVPCAAVVVQVFVRQGVHTESAESLKSPKHDVPTEVEGPELDYPISAISTPVGS